MFLGAHPPQNYLTYVNPVRYSEGMPNQGASMYGIFIDGEHDPYLTCGDLETALLYVRKNEETGRQASAMFLDPLCVCGQEIPGWWDIDEYGDLIDRPCHSACRSDVAAMEHADTWY